MSSIFSLIQNENMKIYRRFGTWFMIGLLALATLAGALIIKATHKEPENWKAEVASEIKRMEAELSEEKLPKMYKNYLKQQLKINEYRLEHNIKPVAPNTFWGYLVDSADIIALITLFTIIVAAGSVASEFSWGTIKLLLIRPASRTKILLSKYIAALLFALCMLLLLFIFSAVVGAAVFGIENIREPYLAYQNGAVVERSMLFHVVQVYALNCADLVMMATFAFMISAVFRNHSLAIGLATFALFVGPQVTALLAMKFDWAKYLLFANTNLTQYIDGTPLVEGMTMSFSLMMLLVYFVIFNGIAWLIFRKRDIAA
ncbi:ABC-2 type transport system permease protein [Parageobacillus thermantarcticus]|uniref:ABC-2 type transport system permease protein n=1 Tax=Parageobacillus thermantarcticus TaxID=186116 RepID=A0A1I0SI78_9BACL|nr:ABC transporter permease [Parageobacillus thermantarcticus]SFA39143.1 ABC-2 type transport system permease protein [Parageobacillus thermantarcticus]